MSPRSRAPSGRLLRAPPMSRQASAFLIVSCPKMEGAIELAEEVFHMPVRLGAPQHVEGLMDVVRNPIHATGVGLLLYGYENLTRRGSRSTPISSNLGDVWGRMKAWFSGQF